jgi:hypothetical protein
MKTGDQNVVLHDDIVFAQTHIAEIQEILKFDNK